MSACRTNILMPVRKWTFKSVADMSKMWTSADIMNNLCWVVISKPSSVHFEFGALQTLRKLPLWVCNTLKLVLEVFLKDLLSISLRRILHSFWTKHSLAKDRACKERLLRFQARETVSKHLEKQCKVLPNKGSCDLSEKRNFRTEYWIFGNYS